MTRIEKLEHEIKKLSPEELAAFRDWFRRYDADEWDRQIEGDIWLKNSTASRKRLLESMKHEE